MTIIYNGWTESEKRAKERLARRWAEHERIMQERESAEIIEWVGELPTDFVPPIEEGCGNDDLYDWARGG